MHMKKIKWKTLIIAVAIPLLTGTIAGLLTAENTAYFSLLEKPPLSPPGWLFPVVWTLLYTLMGIASYFIIESESETSEKISALKVYFLQLAFNFLWSIFFFNLELYAFSFIWLLTLLCLIIQTTLKFRKIDTRAELLMLPYIAWVSFAGYLNLGIALLN